MSKYAIRQATDFDDYLQPGSFYIVNTESGHTVKSHIFDPVKACEELEELLKKEVSPELSRYLRAPSSI